MQVNNSTILHCQSWQRESSNSHSDAASKVSELLKQIQSQGDAAVEAFSQQFDGFSPEWIELKSPDNYGLEPELLEAIVAAASRIETFAQFQRDKLVDSTYVDDCGEFGFRYQAIERIGAYIPGGRFPLISTALMTLIPAKLAGCRERIACSPSDHPAILAAASLAGATAFLKLGGAQAIGALAYGYQDLEPVQMVVGPGNQYVNAAKQLLNQKIQIDAAAGPSELLILADESVNQDWVIADMAAQAEHDPQAQSLLVSDSLDLLSGVEKLLRATDELSKLLDDKQIILLEADSVEQAIDFSNQYAPEHLLLADQRVDQDLLSNFGSLFVGENSAVAYGDYCSGPNHTLPTMGTANRSSGLSVLSFLKVQSVQAVHEEGRKKLSAMGEKIAEAEQLVWHQKSMAVRSS
ncbi:histidinol dehydrogenase [Kangiella geojedonensis]|uniref:Histidinol dehydrogenase n=1 Tax=Kangiella geojedonensis TaxID=914150 RepID=A0A0F6TRF3_9GAMM|nr:histidinol dehydrogenase [Kangiella geojedonensis]AKE52410.1 Histidinol dehydrogenase [Kangiella geojedonensis]